MKIGLLGQFGSGNSGNDGSLEAMLSFLRKAAPDAEFLCICSNPKVVEARYKIPSVGIAGHRQQGRAFRMVDKLMAQVPHRLLGLWGGFAMLHGVDLLIVPGTGILDDFQESAFGWPFVVFRWCLAARLRGARVALVSIGAGPITGRLSRWFMKSVAGMAAYRSFRDGYSLEYMKNIGTDVSADHRYPDIAFGLRAPDGVAKPAGSNPTVGVGVMDYHGWRKGDPRSEEIYRTYLGKLASFTCWLAAQGYGVRLLTGDAVDRRAVDDLLRDIARTLPPADFERISVGAGQSLHDVMGELARVDIAVVSRYHNLVCALKMGRPAISLGYAQKNDELMAAFGLQPFCQHIERFDVGVLKAQVRSVLGNLDALADRVHEVNRDVQRQLGEQQDLLRVRFLGSAAERERGESRQYLELDR